MPIVPEHNAPPEMAAWARWITKQVTDGQRQSSRQGTDAQATSKGLSGTVNGLVRTVSRLNKPVIGWAERSNFSLAGPLAVQFNIEVPDNMDFVNIFVLGHVEALDAVSGGAATTLAYLEVSGSGLTWSRGPFSASKDAGASFVNNIIAPITGFDHEVTPGTKLLVSMNVTGTNPSAFPANTSNFAILQALAIFSKANVA